jgi:sugar phosphate isomerase/epimerase
MADETTRRAFLRALGLTLGGVLVDGACAPGAGTTRHADSGADSSAGAAASRGTDSSRSTAAGPGTRSIGLQLYTVRTLMEKDVEGTLAKVAEIGYREVEFAGYYDRDPKKLRATLDRLQLTAPSAHHPLEALRSNLAGVLDAAQTLGHRYIVCPWIAEPERTLAGYHKIAGEFNQWGKACQDRGLRFAYHNHDFEFKPTDGKVPYDVLLAEADPKLVAMELDLFWVTAGGQDPLAYFEKHPGRFPLWHVKDMRKAARSTAVAGTVNGAGIVPVGEGDIDFGRIFAHAQQAGLDHFFVEHDSAAEWPGGALASVQASYTNLRRLVA